MCLYNRHRVSQCLSLSSGSCHTNITASELESTKRRPKPNHIVVFKWQRHLNLKAISNLGIYWHRLSFGGLPEEAWSSGFPIFGIQLKGSMQNPHRRLLRHSWTVKESPWPPREQKTTDLQWSTNLWNASIYTALWMDLS